MLLQYADLPTYRDHVLVDGGFDPLHAGHIAYLAAARTKGPLVCAVASDEQIRAKGKIPLLPQAQRLEVMGQLALVDHVYAKDRPTEQVLEQVRPKVYVKGPDWRGKLPHEQIDVLARYGIPVWYTHTPQESSTTLLRQWALADAEQSLDRLEAVIQSQQITPPETFDTEYFKGEWREGGNAYTFEKRKEIEGKHPEIIKELWGDGTVLDVGCGPGHLVRLLRDLGVDAGGVDPSVSAVTMADSPRVIQGYAFMVPDKIADVVICREVLEHVPVTQVARTIYDLFRIAKKAVYITTRFSSDAVFDCRTEFDVDPTHISLLSQPYVRQMCVLNGGKRRRDWETALDWQHKGRVLCYEVQ